MISPHTLQYIQQIFWSCSQLSIYSADELTSCPCSDNLHYIVLIYHDTVSSLCRTTATTQQKEREEKGLGKEDKERETKNITTF